MTLLFVDSFDHYSNSEVYAKYENVVSATGAWGIVASGRTGPNAYQFPGSHMLQKAVYDYPTIIMGFAVFCPAAIASRTIWQAYDPVGEQCRLATDGSGIPSAYRGGTVLGTGSTVLGTNSWQYLEIKVTVDTVNGYFEARVDGNVEFTFTGNTANRSNNIFDFIRFGSFNQNGYIDDLYMCNGSGSAFNDFLGPLRVECVLPDEDGSHIGLTPSAGNNYQNVDDNPPNNDTDYNYSPTPGAYDLYGFAPLATGPYLGTSLAVQATAFVRKDDGGLKPSRIVASIGGSKANGDQFGPTDNYVFQSQIWEQNPVTSADWYIVDINAAEFGIEVV